MSIESLIDDARTFATITAEAPDGQVPGQTAMGGADRSDPNWPTVATDVPCLLRTRTSVLAYNRNDERAAMIDATIYFLSDPVPSGLSTRHRITIIQAGTGGPRVLGTYAPQGVIDPNSMGRILQVECERVRMP